jgi:hypothetical protein
MDLKEVCERVDWIQLAQDRVWYLEIMVVNLRISKKVGCFLTN